MGSDDTGNRGIVGREGREISQSRCSINSGLSSTSTSGVRTTCRCGQSVRAACARRCPRQGAAADAPRRDQGREADLADGNALCAAPWSIRPRDEPKQRSNRRTRRACDKQQRQAKPRMDQMHHGEASDQSSTGGQPEIGIPVRAQQCIKWQTEQESYEVAKHQAENSDHNDCALRCSVKSGAHAHDAEERPTAQYRRPSNPAHRPTMPLFHPASVSFVAGLTVRGGLTHNSVRPRDQPEDRSGHNTGQRKDHAYQSELS